MELFTDTPIGKAIFQMFGNVAEWLDEHYDDLPAGAVKVYIFGGCAVYLYTKARGSSDVDAELEAAELLQEEDITIDPVFFEDEDGEDAILEFDANFSTSLGALHPDYKDDSILLNDPDEDIVHLYLVSAVDVAVSKLLRLDGPDLGDIKAMNAAGCFSVEEFKERALEAKDYCVQEEKLQSNIDYAIKMLASD